MKIRNIFVIVVLIVAISACSSGGGGGVNALTAPAAPTGLLITAASGSITLTWIDNANNEDGFKVERGLDGTIFTEISGLLSSNTTTYRDTGLRASTKYYYRVRAGNSAGYSDYSGVINATTTTISIPRSGQTISYAARDDGDLQKGRALPVPRFTAASSGTGTVLTDNLTGLMWPQDGDIPTFSICTGGLKDWPSALAYVACLNSQQYLGFNDWRLPNVNELESLVTADQLNIADWLNGQGFRNMQSSYYWTSTSDPIYSLAAYLVYTAHGYVSGDVKTQTFYFLPVRGEATDLPRTGQVDCYSSVTFTTIPCAGTGQDGDLQKGVSRPDQRFIVGTGAEASCVTDLLTGLMWVQSLDTTARTWTGALDYVTTTVNSGAGVCGHTDWRLSNVKELSSLLDISGIGGFTPALTPGNPFTNVNDYYWTSTTSANITANAWQVNIHRASIDPFAVKSSPTNSTYAWPVRGGN